ncbi:MAG: SsrA-binding protein SmpB [bacterium]|nr:SsrA-binding protein SmpB [bacterium]
MKIYNRRARHNYEILEKVEAGISLLGFEARSVREGGINIDEAYVRFKNGEAYLINAYVNPHRFASPENFDPRRDRKLLLHRKELLNLEGKMKQKKLTLVPVAVYNKGHLVKLEVALARGKKQYEHREAIKRRDLERDIEIELKNGDV